MSSYQLLALDMDGTLLTSDKRISLRTLSAIRSLAERGVAIALSTGRAVNELSAYTTQMDGCIRYASLLSGAHIYDLDARKTIAAQPLESATALAIANMAKAEDAMVHLLTVRTTVASARDIDRMDDVGMGVYQSMFRLVCTVDDPCAYIRRHPHEVCKINLYHTNPDARVRSYQRLSDLDVQLSYAETTSVEVTPRGVNKARGLQQLCDHLGCTLADCVAVGDSPNDTDALRAAGLAVAMGNATDDIIELADMVVADNDHDGIAEVIERLFG